MKFTRDICRLLGIGGDAAEDREEMEVAVGDGSQTGDGDSSCFPQDMLTGEEILSEEERNRRKAERRRAKKRRQKERRRLERGEETEEGQREGEERGAASDTGSEEEEEVEEEKEQTVVVPPRSKATPALAVSKKSNNQPPANRTSEEEPEWDVSSAFVANAASHIRPKGCKTRTGPGHRENKENEGRNCQVESSDPKKRRGVSLTEQGISLFKQGQYTQAVDMFTAAIACDPKDHRFFGNRSHCYLCLERYLFALSDAQKSIQLAPDWPKGYFRKGSALMGLKRYEEAEEAMAQCLRLDKDCGEATSKLFSCRVLQLMELGFEEGQSVLLLEEFVTVQAALASLEAVKVTDHTSHQDLSGSPCPSLWVGNVTLDLTEQHLRDLFKTCGEIESMRVLHERYCAFINFKNAAMAARALEKLQGVELESTRLVIRYPDRWMQRSPPSPQRAESSLSASGPQTGSANAGSRQMAPINGNECYFWRTTGCLYGDKCRFKHIPDQRSKDKKPWQP